MRFSKNVCHPLTSLLYIICHRKFPGCSCQALVLGSFLLGGFQRRRRRDSSSFILAETGADCHHSRGEKEEEREKKEEEEEEAESRETPAGGVLTAVSVEDHPGAA